jgi:hypothetical protein
VTARVPRGPAVADAVPDLPPASGQGASRSGGRTQTPCSRGGLGSSSGVPYRRRPTAIPLWRPARERSASRSGRGALGCHARHHLRPDLHSHHHGDPGRAAALHRDAHGAGRPGLDGGSGLYPPARCTLGALGARLVAMPMDAQGLDVAAGRWQAGSARGWPM